MEKQREREDGKYCNYHSLDLWSSRPGPDSHDLQWLSSLRFLSFFPLTSSSSLSSFSDCFHSLIQTKSGGNVSTRTWSLVLPRWRSRTFASGQTFTDYQMNSKLSIFSLSVLLSLSLCLSFSSLSLWIILCLGWWSFCFIPMTRRMAKNWTSEIEKKEREKEERDAMMWFIRFPNFPTSNIFLFLLLPFSFLLPSKFCN